jgi:hypothetical protein
MKAPTVIPARRASAATMPSSAALRRIDITWEAASLIVESLGSIRSASASVIGLGSSCILCASGAVEERGLGRCGRPACDQDARAIVIGWFGNQREESSGAIGPDDKPPASVPRIFERLELRGLQYAERIVDIEAVPAEFFFDILAKQQLDNIRHLFLNADCLYYNTTKYDGRQPSD